MESVVGGYWAFGFNKAAKPGALDSFIKLDVREDQVARSLKR